MTDRSPQTRRLSKVKFIDVQLKYLDLSKVKYSRDIGDFNPQHLSDAVDAGAIVRAVVKIWSEKASAWRIPFLMLPRDPYP